MDRSSKYICKKVIILMLFIIYLKCVLNLNLFALMSIYVTKELMLSLFACSLELMNRRDFPPIPSARRWHRGCWVHPHAGRQQCCWLCCAPAWLSSTGPGFQE